MDIWHVDNRRFSNLRLWRMEGSDFRVIESGPYNSILVSVDYTLIDKRYGFVFENLNSEVLVRSARIFDYTVNTQNNSYIELQAFNHVDPEMINTLDSKGRKVWTFNGNLFVSGAVKNELLHFGEQVFEFNLGFSRFAG